MKHLKKFFETVLLILGYDCQARRDAVDEGLLDFGGQGRNK